MLTGVPNMISKFHERANELFPLGYFVLLLEPSQLSYPGTSLTGTGVEGVIVSAEAGFTEEQARGEYNRLRSASGLLPLTEWPHLHLRPR